MFDLETGKRVSLVDDVVTDKSELNKALLVQLEENEKKGGCPVDDVKSMGFDASGFRIVSNSEIEVYTSFPHVARACDASAKVSLATIRSVIRPGSLLEKIAKKAGL